MRHGERYPTRSLGRSLELLFTMLKQKNLTAINNLSFLNDYQSPALDSDNYDKETSTGPFSGHASMFLLGAQLRKWYGHLWNPNEKLALFTASQERIVDTAEYVSRGFFGNDWRNNSQLVILQEKASQGLNSLTPDIGCPNYDTLYKADYAVKYAAHGLKSTAKRFNRDLPGANIGTMDIGHLMSLCFYDLNVAGESELCNYFTPNDWVAFKYFRDLDYYFQAGSGNPLGYAVGSVVANASLNLLKESEMSKNSSLFLSFAHDTNLISYLTAFGIGIPVQPISWEQVHISNSLSQLTPMGARVIIEKIGCSDDEEDDSIKKFVRFIINDQVYPYPNCTTGPGFSCPIEEYIQKQESRFVDTATVCGIKKDYKAAKKLTFYWDWFSSPEKYNGDPTK